MSRWGEVFGIAIELLNLHTERPNCAVQATIGDEVDSALQSLRSKDTAFELWELECDDDFI